MTSGEPPKEEGSGRGAAISAFLRKKTGPLPNGAWIFIAAAIGFYIVKRNSARVGQGSGGMGTGDGGTFSSTVTSTDPTTGDQTTYTATGPTSGYLAGGVTTAQASPMGYSGGDIYVNYPGQTTAPTPTPAPTPGRDNPPPPAGPPYPPKQASPAGSGQTGSWWYTLASDTGAGDLANVVYALGVDTSKPVSAATSSILAGDLVNIMRANPQIDWTKVASANNKIPAGTAIYVPLAGGSAGKTPTLPAHASLMAPASYSPPVQQTSMTAVNSVR